MHSIVALHNATGRHLGSFLCAEREPRQHDSWHRSMNEQGATLVKFKTAQDYAEWLQDRSAK